ncbi:MAG TPA: DUF2971 domain-containing protein [Paracoccus solventivorans]|uniref:DUF2971 domain-containing protein n=1 Tax=Paracoccus solventivorans TaxID=53463 RepID=A0A832PNF8_9RHOB|nr:DUF2971 domain-containing protein [Paracoccus solventivorans]HHW34152.1 DUF2971 domain-containing protein [Paracoccus solventivorans]
MGKGLNENLAFWRHLSNVQKPAHLFHYTSAEGLIGIVTSGCFWLSDSNYLNDTQELKEFADYIENVIFNMAVNEGNSLTLKCEDERRYLQELGKHARSAWPGIFIASFTEERDLLSQWRAYCRANAGYSIGVPTETLYRSARAREFWLVPCVYDHREKFIAAREVVEFFLNQLREGKCGVEPSEEIVQSFRLTVTRYGAVFKHRAFSEEKEWRIISSPMWCRPGVKFRAGVNSVIPYVELSFKNELMQDDDISKHLIAVVGPTIDYGSAAQSCQWLVQENFPNRCAFSRSEAPYRAI